MARILVNITVGKKPKADPDPAEVGLQDYVEWRCDGDDFAVLFKDDPGPFGERAFYRGKARTGKPVAKANPKKTYVYSVATAAGSVDPGIIIKQ